MTKKQIVKYFLDSLINDNSFEIFQDKLSYKGAWHLHNYITKLNYLDNLSEKEFEELYSMLLYVTDGEFDKLENFDKFQF